MIILKKNLKSRNIKITNSIDNPKEHVVVDLTVGERYRFPGTSDWTAISKVFKLRPGHCVLIRTQEKIQLPENIFASVFSRGGLSARGLIVSNTKIDPHFSGHLNIPVFNAGKQTIRLSKGEKFCSIAFHQLEQPVKSDSGRDPVDADPVQKVPFEDYIYEYTPHFVAAIVAIVGAAAATYITMKLTPPSQIQLPQESQKPNFQAN